MTAGADGDGPLTPEMYAEARRRVFGLCRLLLSGSISAAEDATSEVFVKAHCAMDTYDRRLSLVTWLLAIARNHCLDVLRRRGREKRLFSDDAPEDSAHPDSALSPLGELLVSEQRAAVRRAAEELPDRLRLALVLRYYEDLSNEEIGQLLGVSRQGAATLVFRARQRLRERLAARVKEA